VPGSICHAESRREKGFTPKYEYGTSRSNDGIQKQEATVQTFVLSSWAAETTVETFLGSCRQAENVKAEEAPGGNIIT
jgi:hypothetical protein